MTDITYRPFRGEDSADVKAIIDESFSIHRYVPRPRLLDSALEIYLRERLVASTWTRVAVKDGRVIGVIMGQVHGEPRLPGGLRNRLLTWAHMLKIGALGLRDLRSLRQYFAFGGVYRALRERTKAPLTDELTLFAVSSAARGLGAGRALYQEFVEHMRRHARTDFYLYTDSLCSFGFYDKHGMVRAAEQDMTIYLDGRPDVLGVYLYAGAVR